MPSKGEPGWKDKVSKNKHHEGYGTVRYEDVWNMDQTLARIISDHLHCFLKALKGPYGGHPGRYDAVYGSEKAGQQWLNDVRKMVYAFEEYQRHNVYADIPEEVRERIREGMQLFIDNYRDLWI